MSEASVPAMSFVERRRSGAPTTIAGDVHCDVAMIRRWSCVRPILRAQPTSGLSLPISPLRISPETGFQISPIAFRLTCPVRL
jgi:hypothetical protein